MHMSKLLSSSLSDFAKFSTINLGTGSGNPKIIWLKNKGEFVFNLFCELMIYQCLILQFVLYTIFKLMGNCTNTVRKS
jgi:hypothetical protein